jgi:tetratricopeptide (TPR) repeat protein
MEKSYKIGITFFALFIFTFSLVSEAYQIKRDDEEKGVKLLKEGELLYESLKYEEAIEKYTAAFVFLKSKENLVRYYLDMSKAYYALSEMIKTGEMLRNMFNLDKGKKINVENYPKGYIRIYFDIQLEFSTEEKPVVKERAATKKKKKTKIWLLVVGSIVSIGILVYFLLIKKAAPRKQYTLTVTIGNGVLGSPDSGIYTYKEGQIVSYDYSLEIDYIIYDLIVKLDGEVVSSSGNIVMERDHTLSAAAQGWWK